MQNTKRYYFKKTLMIISWLMVFGGIIFLLVAADSKSNKGQIAEVNIKIQSIDKNNFIDEHEVREIITRVYPKNLIGSTISEINLIQLESELQKDKWIKNAELFIDNRNVLQVLINQKIPVARLITISGKSFYMDDAMELLPLSNRLSAKLPVFTSCPFEPGSLKKNDSLLLNEIKLLSHYIIKHPFWMAQIDQVDITPDYSFEMIPKFGRQIIRFGSAQSYEEKFNNLLAFYKSVQTKVSWNRYSVIDVQFKNQVVGIKRDAAEIRSDSLKALEIMKNIIADAEKKSTDENQVQLVQEEHMPSINESVERDEVPEDNVAPEFKVKDSTIIEKNKIVQKQDTLKKQVQQPKTLMPPKKK